MPYCKECGEFYDRINWTHLKSVHGIDTYEYYRRHGFLTPMVEPEVKAKIGEGSRDSWGRLTPEEFQRRLENSFHSEEAREKVRKTQRTPEFCQWRSEVNKLYWNALPPEEATELLQRSFLSEEARGFNTEACQTPEACQKRNRSLSLTWAMRPPEEKAELLRKSFHSEEAKRHSREASQNPEAHQERSERQRAFWASLSPEEKKDRLEAGFNSEESKANFREWCRNHQGEDHHNWKGGPRGGYGWAWKDIGFFIFVRDKWTCQKCGARSSLCPHHIDYDRENVDDTNLITLCISCNSKVNGDRQYWRDFFTKKVEEIYSRQV